MSESTLIIGIGNEYRGDDAVGLHVARMLRSILSSSFPEIAIVECGGEGAALLDLWQEAERVILIDASCSGLPAGTVTRFDPLIHPIPPSTLTSSHAFGPAEAIELARQLNMLTCQLVIYAIEGKNFATATELSPEAEQAANDVAQQIIGNNLLK